MAWITDSLRGAIDLASRLNPFNRGGAATGLGGIFSHQLAVAAYMQSGMMRKVIAIPAEDRVSEWRDWQAEADQITAIEAEEERLNLVAKVQEAEVLRGIGGGAIVIITAGDHSSPLTPAMIAKGGIVALNVVSRWQITGKDWVNDLASPRYGEPQMWDMSGKEGQRKDIHPSRVICFRGARLPAGHAVSLEESFWGDSRLLRVYTEVTRSDEAQAWFADLVRKAKLLRIGIPDLLDLEPAQLNARVELIATGENSLNATVYRSSLSADVQGEKIDDYQVTWTGIPAMMDAFDQRVAAVADIPFTRLMGRSPAGMNATGAYDDLNWVKAVTKSQKLETRPCLLQLDPFLLRSAGVDASKVTWAFAPLSVPTEKEAADTFLTTMNAVEKAQNTGAIPEEAFAEAFQNLLVEREYMPGLEQALAKIPETERFGMTPGYDGGVNDPSAIQASGGGDPVASAGSGGASGSGAPARRAANDAWMMEDWAAKPLYVRRDVINRADIVKWAESQGFTDIAPDLHVTITYSRNPVDWMAMGESWRGKLEIEEGGPRLVEALGPDGKYKALLFTAYELISRNQEMRDKGASFDWPEYQPHISIQVGGDIDLATVEPYRGKIVLGPEIFEAIRAEGE